jgi:Resolvase, N terminal domain
VRPAAGFAREKSQPLNGTDIEAGQIDVVVVYKVDRLTRALSDFAKLVHVFDRRGVSHLLWTCAFAH